MNNSITAWEYATLELAQDFSGTFTLLHGPDGTQKKFDGGAKGVTLVLNEVGALGWEVVAAIGCSSSGFWTLT